MAYIKIREAEKPVDENGHPLDDVQRKHIQHEIGNYFKKFVKEVTDKGPETVRVMIFEDVVIVRSDRYLTTLEKYAIASTDEAEGLVKSLRTAAMTKILNEGTLVRYIEEKLGAAVQYVIYESYPKDERCVWLFTLDRRVV